MTGDIEQKVHFDASPHEVYETLMDSERHAKMTGAAATISREVGGSIKAWGNYIVGENLELIQDQKIVQRWRASDWPYGEYSVAIFELHTAATGTDLVFTQTDVPTESVDDISQGWHDSYWDPMKEVFGSKADE